MDEAILSSVAGSIIENLGSAAFEQVGSLWNVKDGLEQIRKTVSTIKAVLQDAAEEQNHNYQDRVWLEKLKEAVFDADDLLDESKYYTELALRQKETSGSITEKVRDFLSLISAVFGRNKISLKIIKLGQELDVIAKDREKFHWKERNTVERIVSLNRETRPWLPHNEVIGREDEKNQIINRLLEPNNEENVLVVAIAGIAGIGKTTLAQCVYNDDRVDAQFELKLSMCFSNVFEVTTFAEKLVNGIDKDDSIGLRLKKRCKFDLEVLMDQVHNMDPLRKLVYKIYQKKFLVVLDDLWNENCKNWNDFKSLLINGAKGSRIVITTRDKSVVDITRAEATYFLEGLSKDYSWSLFEKLAFENSQDTKNPTVVDYGREIVGKCQGVPLAIKSIGNVLYSKKPYEWSKIRDKVVKNVIEQGGSTFPILRLSYDNLPSHLKGCFAFCSLFPKNFEIDKMTMIQLWMAHGFIQLSNDTQQVEDVADEYFKDLLCNFFEKVRDIYGALKYKMHDLYHDLAELIAGSDCRLDNLDWKTRHVSFSSYSFFAKTLSLVKASSKLRTILFTHGKYASDAMEESTLSTLIESFPKLRALDLHALDIKIMPNSIGKLIHLKYLDLSLNPIETLSDSITALLNLQTLKLQDCINLEKLPKDITKLVSLRHLDNSGCSKLRLPQGFRKMTGLQSLPLFVVRNNGGLGELNGLNNLRGKLWIQISEQLEDANLEFEAKNLSEKQHLERLELRWAHQEGHDEMLLDSLQPHPNLKILKVWWYTGVTFSSWLSSIENLVDLTLDQCLRCKHLPPLSKLPFLETFCLSKMEGLEYISDHDMNEEVFALTFFPSLKSLDIWDCFNLKGWWRSASTPDHQQRQHNQSLPSFPRLSSLEMDGSPNMTTMPLFPCLEKELSLYNVSLKPFQETILRSSSTSSFSPLSKLKHMKIWGMEDVVSLPHGWASNLVSLESLCILSCKELNLGGDVDGMEWRNLNRLSYLRFESLPKLTSLPAGLQHITTLKTLIILDCKNLETLPRWIWKLISLESLTLTGCPNLKSLPNEMRNLTSLQTLKIFDCLGLWTRCEKETGQDWHKIAHITTGTHSIHLFFY